MVRYRLIPRTIYSVKWAHLRIRKDTVSISCPSILARKPEMIPLSMEERSAGRADWMKIKTMIRMVIQVYSFFLLRLFISLFIVKILYLFAFDSMWITKVSVP